MNWDLLFDFLFKFENLSNIRNILNLDRKDITAKTYLTCCNVVGSVHLCAFPRPKIILGKGWKRISETFWNLERSKMDGFSDSRPQSLKDPESLVGASLQGWSSRGATLQHWWSRCHRDRRPWRPQSVPLQCQCPASGDTVWHGDTSRVFKSLQVVFKCSHCWHCWHCWHWWHWQIQNMSLAANLHSHINAFKVWRPLDLPQGPDFSI